MGVDVKYATISTKGWVEEIETCGNRPGVNCSLDLVHSCLCMTLLLSYTNVMLV